MDLTRQARMAVEKVWNEGDFATFDRAFSPDLLVHDSLDGKLDRDDYRASIAAYRKAFPDLLLEVQEVVEGLGRVAIRWRIGGTNTAPMRDRPATGRHVEVEGISLLRFDDEDGTVIEAWNAWDTLGFADQLGVISILGAAELEAPEIRAQRDQYVI